MKGYEPGRGVKNLAPTPLTHSKTSPQPLWRTEEPRSNPSDAQKNLSPTPLRFITTSILRVGCGLVPYVSFDFPRWRVVVVFAN